MRNLHLAILTGLVLTFPFSTKAQPPTPKPVAPATNQSRTDCFGDPLPAGAVARLGTVRFRHGEANVSFAFSPDGKTIASIAGEDGIHLWDTATGKERNRLLGHKGDVLACAFSGDGRTLVSVGADNTIRVWELATAKEVRHFRGPKEDRPSAFFSPDAKTLVVAYATIRLWDVATGKELRKIGDASQEIPPVAAMSGNGKYLASARRDLGFIISLWDANSGNELHQVKGHRGGVFSIAFSPDSKILAAGVGAIDSDVFLWDTGTGKELRHLQGHSKCIDSVAFSPDGARLASASDDGTIRIWEVATGKELCRFPGHVGRVCRLAFSPDGKSLATSCGDSSAILLLDAANGKEISSFSGHRNSVSYVGLSHDGKTLITTSEDLTIRFWEAAAGKELRLLRLEQNQVRAIVSPDQSLVAYESDDRETVPIRETVTGKKICQIAKGLIGVQPLVFSADNRLLVVRQGEQALCLYDVAKGNLRSQWSVPPYSTASVAFSPDSKLLAGLRYETESDDQAGILWDATTGKELYRFGAPKDPARVPACCPEQGPASFTVAFTHDGRLLTWHCWHEHSIRLLEVATGRERLRISEKDLPKLTCFALAPDGRVLATAATDKAIQLWDLDTGRKIANWKGHLGDIAYLSFSRDGQHLISGSEDTTALIWDLGRFLAKEPLEKAAATPRDLESWWTDLGSEDATKAHRAVGRLSAAALQAVPFLKERLRAESPTDRQRVRQLIDDLDSSKFEVRQEALLKLTNLGELASPYLKQTLKENPSAEVRRSLEQLLEKPWLVLTTRQRLGPCRAMEVLERIGTRQAQEVLEIMAKGAEESRLTIAARESLAQLRQTAAAPSTH